MIIKTSKDSISKVTFCAVSEKKVAEEISLRNCIIGRKCSESSFEDKSLPCKLSEKQNCIGEIQLCKENSSEILQEAGSSQKFIVEKSNTVNEGMAVVEQYFC